MLEKFISQVYFYKSMTEEKYEKWLKKKLKELYGEKCPDYEDRCACCKAWSVYDSIIADNRGEL